jgi:hypothetical protein
MENSDPIRCRVAACRETLDDDQEWSFYLINDSDTPLDLAVLCEIGYEWGGWGNSETADVRVTDLAPGAHALIWRDDGSGAELRMDLSVRVQVGGREVLLQFEFPKLYRKRNVPVVERLGKPGWAVAAEGLDG